MQQEHSNSKKFPRLFFPILLWGALGTVFGFSAGYLFHLQEKPFWLLILLVFSGLGILYLSLLIYFALYPQQQIRLGHWAKKRAVMGLPSDLAGRAQSLFGWLVIGFSIPFLLGMPIIIFMQAFSQRGWSALPKSVNKLLLLFGLGPIEGVFAAIALLIGWLIIGLVIFGGELLLFRRWVLTRKKETEALQ